MIEWFKMRSGGAIRGKRRILDGKEGKLSDLIFGAPSWWPPPVSVKVHVGWVRMNKHLKCTNAYGKYGIPKLSSFVCRRVG
jgi:hypothetical protein